MTMNGPAAFQFGCRRFTRLACIVVLALLALGCGDDDGASPTPTPLPTQTPHPTVTESQCPSAEPSDTGPCGPTFVLPSWGDAGGWKDPSHYTTIQLTDIDGDGAAELLGRTSSGLAAHGFDRTTGQWMPLTDAGTGLAIVLREFADPPPQGLGNTPPTDWTLPQYYTTIRTARLGHSASRDLVARSAAGIVLYRFVPGSGWTQLTHSGPMADRDCFSNRNCWNSDPSYYATIRLGDIDGDGTDELIGRGGDGVRAYCWDGQAWTQLATPGDLSDANGFNQPEYYETIQLADVDGDGRAELMLRTGQGVKGFKFDGAGRCATGAWRQLDSGSGLDPFCDANSTPFDCASAGYCTIGGRCANQDPSYYTTIQFADIDGEAGDELLGRMADGLWAYKWNGSAWESLATNTDFDDNLGWTEPHYYTTIQAAKLQGGQAAELVARARNGGVVAQAGIIAFSYVNDGWSELEPNTSTLLLEDDPWAASASYYRTIQSGDVDGDGRDDLLGRGPYGIRTWFYDRRNTGIWERYLPYGYPDFPRPEEQQALAELTSRAKNLPQTCSPLPESDASVRSRYDGTDEDVTLSELQAYAACLQGAEGCDCAGDAPPFARCVPPAGSGIAEVDWTAVCNQILAEASAAESVLAVLGHIETIQSSLFIAENAALPGIVSDLKLEEAGSDPSASFTLADAFVAMLEIAGSFAGVIDGPAGGGLDIASELMSSLISAVPSLSDTIDTTYEQLQVEFAGRVEDTQKALAANQFWILQDQGLLAAVGELGSSKGAWQKIDDVGMESMGRYGFALWIYQTILPDLWQRYDISSCVTPADPDYPGCNLSKCSAPPPAPYLSSYAAGGASFTGLMPPDSQHCLPCESVACPDCTNECFFSQFPPDDTVNMVWGALAANCAYRPGNPNTAWTWPDCTLGISNAPGSAMFTNRNGWSFPVVTGNPIIQ